MAYSLRVLERFPVDVLLAIAVAIVLGTFPMTWWRKAFFLIMLALFLVELVWRIQMPQQWKPLAGVLVVFAVIGLGRGVVLEQFETDAVLRDYKTTRDLVAKFQDREVSPKRIVAQYDRLQEAQSLFDSFRSKPDDAQHEEIEKSRTQDVKNALSNFEAQATPVGTGLRIKLGVNLYRVINPVPMRIVPKIIFIGLPVGTEALVGEKSNLGFTVLFLPTAIPIDHFGWIADANF